MNKLQQEKDLFHYIADVVRDLVSNPDKSMAIAQHKREGDFSTQVDIDVENLIVDEIKKKISQRSNTCGRKQYKYCNSRRSDMDY